ncbi:MAG: diaminopimelate epimerase [Bacillota bacterium]|nr:diaminopimelate epimerase [Bacillota bacterium]
MVLFSKYHGCGNNFIIVRESELCESLGDKVGISEGQRIAAYSAFAVDVCDADTGVGADGLIVVRETPALEMVFFNRDGSRAPMCGNGIRCFARFCFEEGICRESSYPVQTLAGEMVVEVTSTEPFRVKINMGKPVFDPAAVNVDYDGENYLAQRLTLSDGSEYEIDSFFMGTVHTVLFVNDYETINIEGIGEEICNHPVFREKTNVNFVKVIDDRTLELMTYERGVGMTLACGTGACASVTAARLRGICGSRVEVRLPLGSLYIEAAADENVYMEGPAAIVAKGAFYQKEN